MIGAFIIGVMNNYIRSWVGMTAIRSRAPSSCRCVPHVYTRTRHEPKKGIRKGGNCALLLQAGVLDWDADRACSFICGFSSAFRAPETKLLIRLFYKGHPLRGIAVCWRLRNCFIAPAQYVPLRLSIKSPPSGGDGYDRVAPVCSRRNYVMSSGFRRNPMA